MTVFLIWLKIFDFVYKETELKIIYGFADTQAWSV